MDNVSLEIKAGSKSMLSVRLSGKTQTKDTVLCLDNEPQNEDGNYSIHVKNSVLDTTAHTGYYSNGSASNGTIQIVVHKKGIKINGAVTK